jgi:hypothetical protein
MRFNSPDVMSPFLEGGINAYAYCQGDPINFADPSGKMKLSLFRDAVQRRQRPTVIMQQRPTVIKARQARASSPAGSSSASVPPTAMPASSSQVIPVDASASSASQVQSLRRSAQTAEEWRGFLETYKTEAELNEQIITAVNKLKLSNTEAYRQQWDIYNTTNAAVRVREELVDLAWAQIDSRSLVLPVGTRGGNQYPSILKYRLYQIRKGLKAARPSQTMPGTR